MRRQSDPESVRQIIAFSLTIAAALVLLLAPFHVVVHLTNDGSEQISASTLLETEGPSILVPLLVPAALTGLPLLLKAPARKYACIVTTAALATFILIASASIGWFYIPALAAALAALLVPSRSRRALRVHPLP
jgi:hypothetical protein